MKSWLAAVFSQTPNVEVPEPEFNAFVTIPAYAYAAATRIQQRFPITTRTSRIMCIKLPHV